MEEETDGGVVGSIKKAMVGFIKNAAVINVLI